MGKCKFNKCWLEQSEFSWLKVEPNNEFEAQEDLQIGHTWCESTSVTYKIRKNTIELLKVSSKVLFDTLLYAFVTSS